MPIWVQWILGIALVANFTFTSWTATKVVDVDSRLCVLKAIVIEKTNSLTATDVRRDEQMKLIGCKLDKMGTSLTKIATKLDVDID